LGGKRSKQTVIIHLKLDLTRKLGEEVEAFIKENFDYDITEF
jgi:hypothetical protein